MCKCPRPAEYCRHDTTGKRKNPPPVSPFLSSAIRKNIALSEYQYL
jgi:hypothetical protein